MAQLVINSLRPLAGVLAVSLLASASARAQCPVAFNAGTPVTALTTDYVLAVADVNGDERPDLLMAGGKPGGAGNAGNNLTVALGNADGTFQAPITISDINVGYGARQILTGFFNADTNLDIAVVSWDGPDVSILLGNGDGSFTLGAGLDATGTHYQCGTIGFFNADTHPDIAVAGASRGVFLGNGDGTFQAFAPLTPTGGGQGCATADFNGDSLADLVFVEGSNFTVYLGNGNGTFQNGVAYTGGGNGRVAVGDVNGDGIPDVIAHATSALNVTLGVGDGTFGPPTTVAGPGVPITDLRPADINGDGIFDVITADAEDGAAVWLGSAANGFRSALPVGPAGLQARQAASGDFNGDGLPDLAVLRYPAGVVSILIQSETTPVLAPIGAVPALNGSVRAILPYLEQSNRGQTEDTIVGGSFTKFGVSPLARIGRYDGGGYQPMGDGLNGTVNALVHFDPDSGGPNPPGIVAGGAFTKSGASVKMPKVGFFDGKFWNTLGHTRVITPAANTAVEGDRSETLDDTGAVWVSQILYQSTELGQLRPGDIIRGVSFRLDGGGSTYPVAPQVWPRFDIKLGQGVPVLGQTFAKNFASRPVTVRSGPLTMESGVFLSTGAPRLFGLPIMFNKPFVYNGGNLLLETRTIAPAEALIFDAMNVPTSVGEARFAGGQADDNPDATIAEFEDHYVWIVQWVVEPGPASGFNGNVNALVQGNFAGQAARGADPVLVAGGAFTKSGTAGVNRVAMWDGDKWIQIGAGFNGAVNALIIADLDGAGPQGNSLVAAGAFTRSGSTVLNRIARFDGTSWQPLGPGFNGAVNALAVHAFPGGVQLVAGGAFTKSGETVANRVARFDGLAWLPIGEGFGGVVNSLSSESLFDTAVPALVAGGAFTRSGATAINRLAFWKRDHWEQLGGGASSTVRALKATPESTGPLGPVIKVGGDFKKLGPLVQPFLTAVGCEADALRAAFMNAPASRSGPCSVADLAGGGADGARPDGQIGADDLLAFLRVIDASEAEPASPDDVPEGETSLADDILAFVTAFANGC